MKRWRMIAYSVGALGSALAYNAFNNRIQFFYIVERRLDPAWIGAVWFIFGLWNALNDPLMGQLSDNTRSRFGRRIPYVAFATLPMAIFFVLMWLAPRGAGTWGLFAYFTITVFAFDTLWTLVVIAWTALFPEMISDLKERATVSGWRQIFSIVGVILALALTPIIIDRVGWAGMALTFGMATAAAFFISLLGSHERPELYHDEEAVSLGQALKAGFSSRSFRWFMLANLAKEFIFNVMVAALPFYARYVLQLRDIPGGLDAATQEALLLGVPFILSVPGMFVWTKIIHRVGSRRAWIYASLAFLPGLIVIFLAQTYPMALVGSVLLVLGFPGLLMLADLVISDVIDEDELNTGRRREGLFFGVNGAVIRLAFSAEAILIGTIPKLTGFDAAVAVQPAAAVWGFRFLVAGGPVLGILVAIFALTRYPLDGQRLLEMRSAIDELHRKKAERLLGSRDSDSLLA